MNNETSQKAFEVWATASVLDTSTWSKSPEVYKSNFTTDAWDAWQASRKALEAEKEQEPSLAEILAGAGVKLRTQFETNPVQAVEPVAWGMKKDGLMLDIICPDEHEAFEGDYTIPLYTHPAPPPAAPTVKQPLSTERAELIARLQEARVMMDYNPVEAHDAINAAAAMLKADVSLINEGNTVQQAAVPAWMPIETAPPDGQCLLWVDTEDGGEAMTLLRDSNGCWLYEGEPVYSASFYIKPTHWMPLPTPPKEIKELLK